MSGLQTKGRLLLLGAGGHGRVVADIAEASGWQDVSFLDDRWPQLAQNLAWSVIGKVDEGIESLGGAAAFVTIGDNRSRLRLLRRLMATGATIPVLVHPSAVVSRHAVLGAGSVVMPNAVVNAGAVIGDGVIVNTGATIDHDCRLADGVHVSPGAHLAGGVSVGEASWVGIGAAVRESIRIGAGVMIGAGAAVVSDIPDLQIATGVPARGRSRS
ncbi:acetyltransferase [Kaistia sp. MMO-174]|uniref:acetyltransferase n=1 Tax=Kaistia sp. MMO-174 TaxID=3081256 RepID=UPI003017E13B